LSAIWCNYRRQKRELGLRLGVKKAIPASDCQHDFDMADSISSKFIAKVILQFISRNGTAMSAQRRLR
jgi:hypothetical protein